MKIYIIFGILISALMYTSCTDDLDVTPADPDIILAGNLGDDPVYMKQALAKIYTSFILYGQGDDDADIQSDNDNFFITMRALWNLQTITTDEGICAWGDPGISDLNTQDWSSQNPFLTAVYQRLNLNVTYANDFLNTTEGTDDTDFIRYRAEARYLRALAYYWLMDLFGNPPFTTEEDGVGSYYPEQIQRADLFKYVVNELKDIEEDLGEPGFSYPQADKGACWMLLAKTYLNAEVYIGTTKWDSCKIYCDKVIASNYELADDYRQNFSADNDRQHGNMEMIFAFAEDGINTQGNGGTTFIIESSSDATYIPAKSYHGLTSNTDWNGNRARKDFMNILVDTLAVYGNNPVPSDDTIFAQCPDQRVFLRQKRSINIPSSSSSGDYGIGVYKFTAKNHDGTQADNYDPTFACTDFPVFRLADAYLMRAEALYNLGNTADAVTDINVIRERAYGNTDGNITSASLTSEYILDERAREFYYEGQRRTDLIRFGQYTNGSYHWQWKGGVFEGISTSTHYNLFPIPGDEISANPNIEQNPGY